MSIFFLILGLIMFVGLVVIHEFGHFLVARRNGVTVEEFGIGFPPRVWQRKTKSGFIFSVNLLPLGGFVKLKGENDSSRLPGSFGAASLPSKIKILLAGVAMNLLTAFVLLTFLALIGLPRLIDNQFTVASDTKIIREVGNKGIVIVDEVVKDSPATQAGLKPKDQFISIAQESIFSTAQIGQITRRHAGEKIDIVVKRDGQSLQVVAQLNAPEQAQNGYLGVASRSAETGLQLQRSTWSAPVVGLGLIKQFTILTYQGLASVVVGLSHGNTAQASEQVAGPVGVFVLLKDGSKLGINFTLMIIAVISLTLALMNVLPIPALDGGRLFVMLAFRASRQKLTRHREELIHGTGFVLLMGLFALATFVDIKRFF